jgi:Protein of unknown function (DUF3891)
VIAIGQPSHSWLSGQLARAWVGEVEPFAEVCLAAEQHDIGMGPWDADPDRNPDTGLPYAFTEMPVGLHLRYWREGPRRLLVQSRYAALLASLHGARLQRMRDSALPGVREYLEEEGAFQQRLMESLRTDPERLKQNHELLWTWDFLSLALCLDWAPTSLGELGLSPAGERKVAFAPWPFRPPTLTVRCEGRRLQGPYDSDEAMRRALAEAPWVSLEFELVPE